MSGVARGPLRVAAAAGLVAGLGVGAAHTLIQQPGTDEVAQALARHVAAASGRPPQHDGHEPHEHSHEAGWFAIQAGVGVAGLVYVVALAGSRRGGSDDPTS